MKLTRGGPSMTGVMGHVVARLMGLTHRGRSIRAVTDCADRAETLRKAGRLEEALSAGREGLSLFRSQGMLRDGPAESTLFLGLTVFVEEVATELGRPGAEPGSRAKVTGRTQTTRSVINGDDRPPNNEMKQAKPAIAGMPRSSLLISVFCRHETERVMGLHRGLVIVLTDPRRFGRRTYSDHT